MAAVRHAPSGHVAAMTATAQPRCYILVGLVRWRVRRVHMNATLISMFSGRVNGRLVAMYETLHMDSRYSRQLR